VTGLSPAQALLTLRKIEGSLDAYCATAPRTIASMGGRAALQHISQMTCIGPIPRLDAQQWERMSTEYFDAMRDAARQKLGLQPYGSSPSSMPRTITVASSTG
jgi:hypothetical protein